MRTVVTLSTDQKERWFKTFDPRPEVGIRLFCFHYAGGSASMFRGWPKAMPADVETVAIQLPGRENRFAETPYNRMGPLVRRLVELLEPQLDRPFAFFGCSMGARLSFALAHALRERGLPMPRGLFVAASPGPALETPVRGWNESDTGLVGYLRDLGGTPADVLAQPDLLALLLPTVRADLTVVATRPYDRPEALDLPLRAFAGVDDPYASPERMRAWGVETSARFELDSLPGGHFFIHSAIDQVLDLIREDLRSFVDSGATTGVATAVGEPA